MTSKALSKKRVAGEATRSLRPRSKWSYIKHVKRAARGGMLAGRDVLYLFVPFSEWGKEGKLVKLYREQSFSRASRRGTSCSKEGG